MQIHNCHTHVFTLSVVPKGFLPFGLVRFLARSRVSRWLGRFLHWLVPYSDNDVFDRYAAYLNIGSTKTQRTIFKHLYGCYPENSKIVALSMDMEHMGAGPVRQDFRSQLEELAAIKREYPENILPFIAVDPRREGILELVQQYIEDRNFAGIKLYPPLGYYPYDDRLDEVYEYAQAKQVPIIAHCSPGGVYFRGTITDDMLKHPKAKEWHMAEKRNKNKDFCGFFAHPENYHEVYKKFPELKVCLAHAGGSYEWQDYLDGPWRWPPEPEDRSWLAVILDMLRQYPHLYTDVSYTAHDKNLHALLKMFLQDQELRPKFLYGSDFYMVRGEISERAYSVNLRVFLGETDYRQLADTNPTQFLAMKAAT